MPSARYVTELGDRTKGKTAKHGSIYGVGIGLGARMTSHKVMCIVLLILLPIFLLLLDISVWSNVHLVDADGNVPIVCNCNPMSKVNGSLSHQCLVHLIRAPNSFLI